MGTNGLNWNNGNQWVKLEWAKNSSAVQVFRDFFSTKIYYSYNSEGGGYLFNSSLPLPPASQTIRHKPGDYCRDLTSAHSYQLDSNQEHLVSERNLLSTKLQMMNYLKLMNRLLNSKFPIVPKMFQVFFVC